MRAITDFSNKFFLIDNLFLKEMADPGEVTVELFILSYEVSSIGVSSPGSVPKRYADIRDFVWSRLPATTQQNLRDSFDVGLVNENNTTVPELKVSTLFPNPVTIEKLIPICTTRMTTAIDREAAKTADLTPRRLASYLFKIKDAETFADWGAEVQEAIANEETLPEDLTMVDVPFLWSEVAGGRTTDFQAAAQMIQVTATQWVGISAVYEALEILWRMTTTRTNDEGDLLLTVSNIEEVYLQVFASVQEVVGKLQSGVAPPQIIADASAAIDDILL